MKTSRALQTTVYFIVASWTETEVYPHGTEQKWQPLAILRAEPIEDFLTEAETEPIDLRH